jgi:hypothetical protein
MCEAAIVRGDRTEQCQFCDRHFCPMCEPDWVHMGRWPYWKGCEDCVEEMMLKVFRGRKRVVDRWKKLKEKE